MAALLAGIIVLRRPDAVTTPQFWAEDSTVFFWQQLTLGFRGALRAFWSGYPCLLQRLVAWLGAWVPLVHVPRVYSSSAIVVTAIAVGTFVLPGFRHLVRSDVMRVLWCVAVVSLPVDQGTLSTLAYVVWPLGIWLALLSMMRVPSVWWRTVPLALAGTVATFSTPLAFVTAPVWLLRAWHALGRRRWTELTMAAGLLGALVGVVVITRDLGVATLKTPLPDGTVLEPLRDPFLLLSGWTALVTDRMAALVLSPDALNAVRTAGATAGIAALLVVLVTATGYAGRWSALPAVLLAAYFAFGSLALVIVGRPVRALANPADLPYRYELPPAAMLVLALVAAVDGLSGQRRKVAGVALFLIFAAAWRPTFVVTPFIDRDWPTWAARLEDKLARRGDEPLEIPMIAKWSPLRVDVRELSKEINVSPEYIVASLGVRGSFVQTFVSRCDGLSEVDLFLGTMAEGDRGEVAFTVTDAVRGPVATVRRPRSEFGARGWYPFYFPPVSRSARGRYTAMLQAIENEEDASLIVLGGRGDPYPAGEALVSGKRIEADATMRYGCTIAGTAAPRPASPFFQPGLPNPHVPGTTTR